MASPGVYFNTIDNSQYLISDNPAQYAIVGPTVKGIPYIPTIVKGYNDFTSKFGDSFTISGSNTTTEYLTSIAVKNFYDSAGNNNVPLLVTRIISGAYVSGSGLNSSVLSTYAKSDVPVSGSTALSYTSSFTLETITWGDSVNNNTGSYISGSLVIGKGFKWSITSGSNTSNTNPNGLFKITLTNNFGSNDTNTPYSGWMTLDPNDSAIASNSATYIGKALGDIKYILNQDTNNNYYITTTGSYPIANTYIRLSNIGTYTYTRDDAGNLTTASFNGVVVSGSSLKNIFPLNGSGLNTGSFSGGLPATNRVQYMNEKITNTSTNSQGYVTDDYTLAFNILQDSQTYPFGTIVVPGLTLANTNASISGGSITSFTGMLAKRGNSFAPIDPVGFGSSIPDLITAVSSQDTNNIGAYWPWVNINNINNSKVYIPLSTLLLGLYYNNDQSNVWAAPAGLTRGGINILQPERTIISQADRDIFYNNRINPILINTSSGTTSYYIWGQKTLQFANTLLNRINVRRLVIYLQKYIYDFSLALVFEQSNNTLITQFTTQTNSFLNRVQTQGGIYAYRVIMDETNNSNNSIDQGILNGTVIIQPTPAVEVINITFNIQPTGTTITTN